MIKIIKSDKSWMEGNAIEQLKKVAELKGIVNAVGLPDLHLGKTPVGASFVSKGVIYPHIVGNDIGCGMSLFITDFNKAKFKVPKIMRELEKLEGLENLKLSGNFEDKQFLFKDKLGTIGGGNHFAEFQELAEIYDEEAALRIGLNKNKIHLLVHSGSRSYGEYILRKYIEQYVCQNGLEIGSKGFTAYMEEHDRAVEFAKINREEIAYRLLNYLSAKEYKKLLDSVHNSVTEKQYDGETHYIHRKGAAPSDIGCVVIAGSRGTKSYIVEPRDDLKEYAFSLSHGAGRKWSRQSCKERLENVYSKKAVRQNNFEYNLICSDKKLVYEEAPEAYKNIERVIEDMVNENMIRVVAALKPLITFKA